MKCHNCKTSSGSHEKEGCDHFELDIVDNSKLLQKVHQILRDCGTRAIRPDELLTELHRLSQQDKFRKALRLRIEITPRVIAEAVEVHFKNNTECKYDCEHMDKLIAKWTMSVQKGKRELSNETALRAFRRVLVEGERDW